MIFQVSKIVQYLYHYNFLNVKKRKSAQNAWMLIQEKKRGMGRKKGREKGQLSHLSTVDLQFLEDYYNEFSSYLFVFVLHYFFLVNFGELNHAQYLSNSLIFFFEGIFTFYLNNFFLYKKQLIYPRIFSGDENRQKEIRMRTKQEKNIYFSNSCPFSISLSQKICNRKRAI